MSDIEAVSDALQRPLHLAVEKGHLALAQLLLTAGAQVLLAQ